MKNNFRKQLVIALILLISAFFTACGNILSFGDDSSDRTEDAVLQVSGSVTRTIFPNVAAEGLDNYELKGTKAGENEQTLGSYDSFESLTEAKITLQTGEWTFKLIGTKLGSEFSSVVKKSIGSGINYIEFEMTPSILNTSSGSGSISIQLDFPAQVKAVEGVLLTTFLDPIEGYGIENLHIENGKALYAKDEIPSGSYIVKFILYADDLKTVQLSSYCEMVNIANGMVSSAQRTITDLNESYSIVYEMNGGVLKTGVYPACYSRYSEDIILPDSKVIVRDGYYFVGWFATEDFSGEPISRINTSDCENKHLYAKWSDSDFESTVADVSSILSNAPVGTFTLRITDENPDMGLLNTKLKTVAQLKAYLVNLDLSCCVQLKEIPEDALKDNPIIKCVILPESVVCIESGAFEGCSALTEIIIPENVTYIKPNAFKNSDKLTVRFKNNKGWKVGSVDGGTIEISESDVDNGEILKKSGNLYHSSIYGNTFDGIVSFWAMEDGIHVKIQKPTDPKFRNGYDCIHWYIYDENNEFITEGEFEHWNDDDGILDGIWPCSQKYETYSMFISCESAKIGLSKMVKKDFNSTITAIGGLESPHVYQKTGKEEVLVTADKLTTKIELKNFSDSRKSYRTRVAWAYATEEDSVKWAYPDSGWFDAIYYEKGTVDGNIIIDNTMLGRMVNEGYEYFFIQVLFDHNHDYDAKNDMSRWQSHGYQSVIVKIPELTEDLFRCPNCGTFYETQEEMLVCGNKDGCPNKYICENCGTGYPTWSERDSCDKISGCPEHYECPNCGSVYSNEYDASRCSKNVGCPRHYECSNCGTVYFNEYAASLCSKNVGCPRHYECSNCGTVYFNEYDASRCSINVGCPNYFMCDYCDRGYATEEERDNCANSYRCPKYYYCQNCGAPNGRNSCAKQEGCPKFYTGTVTETFEKIPEGTLNDMVTIPAFYMSNHEVTQAEYCSIMGSNPSQFAGESYEPAAGENQGDRPVDGVSWYDAIIYCNKRSLKEGLNPCYKIEDQTNPDDWGLVPTSEDYYNYSSVWQKWEKLTCDFTANGYRLPTKDEWQYAAEGGEEYQYCGSDTLIDVAWYEMGSGNKTHEVMKKQKNGYDLYDMFGNVSELVWDKYEYMSEDSCCCMGGSYSDDSSFNYGYYRSSSKYDTVYYNNNGFRLVRTSMN